jgi:hypothetical protein
MELRKTLVGQLSPRMALLTLFVSLTGLLQTAAGVTSYKVQKINPAGATTSYAIGINASNNVVGNYTTSTGVVLGYKFAAGKYTIIKFPTANKFTRANGINDAGLIVGDFFGKDNFYHGFKLSAGKYTQFDISKGTASTSIFAVNNNGDFGGASAVAGPNEGFVSIGGVVSLFSGSGTDSTLVLGLNKSGESVGQYFDFSGNSHGFSRDSSGTITEIVYPGAAQTACLGITDAGVITGWYINSLGQSYGFTDNAGVFTSSDFLENYGMNASGAFATYYAGPGASGAQLFGLLVTPHTMKSLSTVAISKALSTSVFGVNNSGALTGSYENSASVTHGFLLAGGKLTNLDDPNALAGTTTGEGVSSTNQVVGYYTNTSNASVGFLYSAGTYTDIAPPGATQTYAQQINDAGVIAGSYIDSSSVEHGFTLTGSTYTTIDAPGATSTYVWGLNANGETTMTWVDAHGFSEGAIYNGTTFTTLNVPGATDTFAHSINKSGDIVFSWLDINANYHAAVLIGGSYYIFDDATGSEIRADGINDAGLMVGRFLQAGSTTNYDGFKGMN